MFKCGKDRIHCIGLYFILYRQIDSQRDWRTLNFTEQLFRYSGLNTSCRVITLLWLLIYTIFPPALFPKKWGWAGVHIYRKSFNLPHVSFFMDQVIEPQIPFKELWKTVMDNEPAGWKSIHVIALLRQHLPTPAMSSFPFPNLESLLYDSHQVYSLLFFLIYQV